MEGWCVLSWWEGIAGIYDLGSLNAMSSLLECSNRGLYAQADVSMTTSSLRGCSELTLTDPGARERSTSDINEMYHFGVILRHISLHSRQETSMLVSPIDRITLLSLF